MVFFLLSCQWIRAKIQTWSSLKKLLVWAFVRTYLLQTFNNSIKQHRPCCILDAKVCQTSNVWWHIDTPGVPLTKKLLVWAFVRTYLLPTFDSSIKRHLDAKLQMSDDMMESCKVWYPLRQCFFFLFFFHDVFATGLKWSHTRGLTRNGTQLKNTIITHLDASNDHIRKHNKRKTHHIEKRQWNKCLTGC